MDLRALKYFVSVFEQGSVSAASKACYVAQPSISSSIQQLENNLGRRLFERHARGVSATEAGEQLYPLAKKLLGQAQAIQGMFEQTKQKTPFRLGLAKGLGVARMSSLLKRFTTANENMELTLVPLEDECDARIINKASLESDEKFVSMWQERFSLAIPINHPLCLKRKIHLEDLQSLPFIQRTPCEAWDVLTQQLNQNGMQLDIRAKIQTIEYAVGLVKAGVGCALIPDYSEIDPGDELISRHIDGVPLTRHIGLAYCKRSEIVRSIEALVTEK